MLSFSETETCRTGDSQFINVKLADTLGLRGQREDGLLFARQIQTCVLTAKRTESSCFSTPVKLALLDRLHSRL
jgi:hypothetical protein